MTLKSREAARISFHPQHDEDAYEILRELSAELGKRREAIGSFNELIASIALTHEAALISTDGHFQRVPGLTIITP
jgi:predicted nucleic acid-binding protein